MDYQKIIERNVTNGLMYRESPVFSKFSRSYFKEISELLHLDWTPELVNAQLGAMDYAVATDVDDKFEILETLKSVGNLGSLIRSIEIMEFADFIEELFSDPSGIYIFGCGNHEESMSKYLKEKDQKC